MPYVIKRTDQGGGYYCDPHGKRGSVYTGDIAKARSFTRREDAEKQRCPGNEIVVDRDGEMQRPSQETAL